MIAAALNGWFSFTDRRGRVSFTLAILALLLTLLICYMGWLIFAQTDRGRGLGIILFGIPAVLCNYLLTGQRFRDFNVGGWWSLIWIPINALQGDVRAALTIAMLVALCGIPGTAGENKYG